MPAPSTPPPHLAVIGGGPAGLRAAEVAAEAGARVTLYDAKLSVGRKFLVAGKSGLNLTHSAPFDDFVSRYSGDDLPADTWRSILADFDNTALRAWSASLGIPTIATSSGKVFPAGMKAAPLLRRWVERLRALGVQFAMHHRWTALRPGPPLRLDFARSTDFQSVRPATVPGAVRGTGILPVGSVGIVPAVSSPDPSDLASSPATVTRTHDAVILALGGASWPATGSDGAWVPILENLGIEVRPLRSANCGWECPWTPATRDAIEGKPLVNLHVRAGETVAIGELMLTRYGLEGTLIYHLGRALRAMEKPEIHLDLKPTFTADQLVRKMESARRNFLHEARARWKLPEQACVILEQFHGPFTSAGQLAQIVKDCRLPLTGPRPVAEAISTAGGIAWPELTDTLMLRRLPKVYAAGEMLDWDAPTGGFLLQACFATGTRAGRAAAL